MWRFGLCFCVLLNFVVFCNAARGEITPEMMERFERLEAETVRLRAEVAELRKAETPQVSQPQAQQPPATQLPVTQLTAPQPQAQQTIPAQEVSGIIDQRIEQERWRKGPVTVRPYGMFWFSILGADSRFAPSDSVAYMLPEEAYGQSVCALSARRSRLGLKVDGASVDWLGGMEMSGKLEIDFMGEVGALETKPSVLFREVYWKAENDYGGILFGQTKDVVSPLVPKMLNYHNTWGSGNLGYRNPQLRFTRNYYLGGNSRMELQTALSQMCGPDFCNYDHTGSYPTIQSRLGWSIAQCGNPYPIQFGISGHIGEQRYDFPGNEEKIQTWSMNVDFSVPFTSRCGVRGEIFHGQGLAGMNGGIFQSIDYAIDGSGGFGTLKSIHSTGGWSEFWWDITSKLHYCVGAGVDDPLDSDMEAAARRKNSVVYTNFVYDFTPWLRTGVEYSYWRTLYAEGNPGGDKGSASVVEWMWQFEF